MKWAARSPIGHSFPPHQASKIPLNFCPHKHSRLSFTRSIRQPARHPTVYCGIAEFFDRDRRTNSAHPSRFGQGIKSPRRPNFALKMYPIKQSRHSIAWRNQTTPEHQDVDHGVEVGWTRRFHFIAPRGFVGGHGRMRKWSTYHDVNNKFSTLYYDIFLPVDMGTFAMNHRTTLSDLPPKTMKRGSPGHEPGVIHLFHERTAVTMIVRNRVAKK